LDAADPMLSVWPSIVTFQFGCRASIAATDAMVLSDAGSSAALLNPK
jgi:hypothetical protein